MGNPPFNGASTMRAALGDGYVEALRKTWPEVPESADFVMHWWSRAALMVTTNKTRQFGLITIQGQRPQALTPILRNTAQPPAC